jgi:hypothetical protein
VAPDGRAGADLHDPVALAVAAGHGDPPPGRGAVGEGLGAARSWRGR